MPVENFTDIDLGTDENTFDQLDKAAAKAQKSLEKRNKELQKTQKSLDKAAKVREEAGGAFPQADVPIGSGAAKDIAILSKQDKKIEKRLKKLQEKIKKDEAKQLGDKETILDKILGRTSARNLISMGKNPKNFMFGIMKALPILGGVLAAKDIADFIIDEIVKLDKFLKVFIDEIDNRLDPFRTLLEQAFVVAGLSQRIITTAAGGIDPRYSYNTFEEFNTNQADLEERFQMTNNSGVE